MLDDLTLNRATLARQLLLQRVDLGPIEAIEHLVGLQAQNPLDPYVGLWSRLARFDPVAMGDLVESRALVRMPVMRGTIHLLTATDALTLRPLMQPVLDAEIARHSQYAPLLQGLDLAPVLEVVRDMLADEPMSGPRLRTAIGERFPELPAAAVAYAARCELPLVQVPPRGVWGKTSQVAQAPLDAWVGRGLDTAPSMETTLLRYLAAFGPATAADVASWCRLTGLRAVIDRVRSQLFTYRDARGRELVDLADAPRPDPETPAPVRFLPEYDNVLLSHADRTRFFDDDERRFAAANAGFKGWVLVDGHVRGVWHLERDKGAPVAIAVEHMRLAARDRDAVANESEALARLWHPDGDALAVRLVAAA